MRNNSVIYDSIITPRLTRWEKNKLRHKQQLATRRRTQTCEYCGGQMTWCSLCQVYSRTCCVDWGTCMCS